MQTAAPQRSALLQELLPQGIAVAELWGEADPADLMPVEQNYAARVSPRRARHFAGGRLCARHALEQMEIRDYPLPAVENRNPSWPPHLTGSITHTEGFAAAAVGRRREIRGIGIDAERVGSVSAEIWEEVFSPLECRFLSSLQPADSARVSTLLFSAREAFYKCQFPLTGQWLEFRDVDVDLAGWDLRAGSFLVRSSRRLAFFAQTRGPVAGSFFFDHDIAVTAMTVEVPGQP